MKLDGITERIIAAAIEVHRELGPGLLESVYQNCMQVELCNQGLIFESEVQLPVWYKGRQLDSFYRVNMVVEKEAVLELKAVDHLLPVYKAQLLSYLKLSGKKIGLLINFNVPVLKSGIKRVVNNY